MNYNKDDKNITELKTVKKLLAKHRAENNKIIDKMVRCVMQRDFDLEKRLKRIGIELD